MTISLVSTLNLHYLTISLLTINQRQVSSRPQYRWGRNSPANYSNPRVPFFPRVHTEQETTSGRIQSEDVWVIRYVFNASDRPEVIDRQPLCWVFAYMFLLVSTGVEGTKH